MPTIPASFDVTATPSVLATGGAAFNLNALMLTTSARVPIGTVLSFPSPTAVATFFGPPSNEAAQAAVHFAGFTNSNMKPGALKFVQYNTAAVSAWLRGGSMSGLTLTQLQAFSGTLSLTVDGTVATSSTISLSAASSFSNAATIIQTAFTAPAFAVTYDSVAGAFVFTTTLTGAPATITYAATGSLAANLCLTQATGATISQGAAAVTSPSAFMTALTATYQNFATFMTLFDPDGGSGNAEKLAFATWNGQQNDRYAYVCWDTDITPTESTSATTCLGYLLAQASVSGTILVYEPSDLSYAAFICGYAASIDYTETQGNTTLKFRSQSSLVPSVFSDTVAANLTANGYNFYGTYATGTEEFTYMSPGSVSGPYSWANSYLNQIWLNQEFIGDMMTLLTQTKSIPYNSSGRALVSAALGDTITAAGTFGLYQPNVTLSALQIAEVNTAAGVKIDTILSSRGCYLQVLQGSAQTRSTRGSPPCTFWFVDGGSIQKLNLASVELQ